MSEAGAEKALEAVRRLGENKACANCQTVASHGHGAVVMTFGIFVCSTCKSAHQSYSHLCKSVSMSYWKHAEVEKVRGGGNSRARACWMARCPEGARPKKGVTLEAAKAFVRECYVEKRWYSEGAARPSEAAPRPAPAAVEKPVVVAAPKPVVVQKPKPAPVPKGTLLAAPPKPTLQLSAGALLPTTTKSGMGAKKTSAGKKLGATKMVAEAADSMDLLSFDDFATPAPAPATKPSDPFDPLKNNQPPPPPQQQQNSPSMSPYGAVPPRATSTPSAADPFAMMHGGNQQPNGMARTHSAPAYYAQQPHYAQQPQQQQQQPQYGQQPYGNMMQQQQQQQQPCSSQFAPQQQQPLYNNNNGAGAGAGMMMMPSNGYPQQQQQQQQQQGNNNGGNAISRMGF